jgi:hypothetical protein
VIFQNITHGTAQKVSGTKAKTGNNGIPEAIGQL